MKIRRPLTDLTLSVLAGYVGTKAMEPVSMKLYQRAPARPTSVNARTPHARDRRTR